MKHLRQIYCCICLMICTNIVWSQDINFSQFYDVPLLRNPSLAGIFTGDVRITAGYRNQWQSVTTPYSTVALGGEMKFPFGRNGDDFLTIGMQLTHDVAGDSRLGKTQLFPVLNFHKSIGDNSYLSAGIMGGGVQHRFDPSKLQFGDQYVNGSYDPSNTSRQTFSRTNLIYWDLASGLTFSSVLPNDVKFYLGTGIFHFTKPVIAFINTNTIQLQPKYVVNGGISVPAGDENRLQLYLDYFLQGGNNQGQAGLMFSKNLSGNDDELNTMVTGGLMYRLDDAIIPVIKFDYNKLGLGLSYDVNISKLAVASHARGGAELMLVYKDFLNSRNDLLNRSKCPAF